jgi:23S rRNA (adenine-N6)-dimethyltransferase
MGFQHKELTKYNIKYSQNFFKSDILSHKVIELAGLSKNDIVIEIGPGKGALTKFVFPKVRKLIAVEKDEKLFTRLLTEYRDIKNIELINNDFLKYKLPDNIHYKVIGNIPFGITTEILKKILEAKNKPDEIYLVLQKEAALRFLGSCYKAQKENLFSLRYKPFFQGEIVKIFNKNDFIPRSGVSIVMLHITKRSPELIESINTITYLDFITFCFTIWKRNLGEVLKKLFTDKQIRVLKKQYNIDLNLKPTEAQFADWLVLFSSYMKYSPNDKQRLVKGSFVKLSLQQAKLVKRKRTILA